MGHVPHGPEHDADVAAPGLAKALTGIAPEPESGEELGLSRKALVAFCILALVAVAALVALGTWQVHRLAWKRDLIARVEARVHASPVAAPERERWSEVTAASHEYRRVAASGTLLEDKTALVQALTQLGAGYWVMTPLRRADGAVVLVNRGFVPADRRDPTTWGTQAGPLPTSVTGLLRISEPGGGFLRANDAASGRWYSRDVQAIAAAYGLRDVAPYFIDAEKTPGASGLPVAGLTVTSFPNNHLVYAATWYTLALMLAAAAALITVRSLRRQRLPEDGASRSGKPPEPSHAPASQVYSTTMRTGRDAPSR
jgi:surfeit locus 1 family protein